MYLSSAAIEDLSPATIESLELKVGMVLRASELREQMRLLLWGIFVLVPSLTGVAWLVKHSKQIQLQGDPSAHAVPMLVAVTGVVAWLVRQEGRHRAVAEASRRARSWMVGVIGLLVLWAGALWLVAALGLGTAWMAPAIVLGVLTMLATLLELRRTRVRLRALAAFHDSFRTQT